jgi:hypothetical protein
MQYMVSGPDELEILVGRMPCRDVVQGCRDRPARNFRETPLAEVHEAKKPSLTSARFVVRRQRRRRIVG